MKLVKITLVLLIVGCIYKFITSSGKPFHIARTLPFCSGEPVEGIYEIAGFILIGFLLWGLFRLNRNTKDDDE